MTKPLTIFLCSTDQQADWVLPAVGPTGETGERQEEIGQETTVHASSILGILLPLRATVQKDFTLMSCRWFLTVMYYRLCR